MTTHRVRILLTGGGSGGHLYPLLAVAEALQTARAEKGIDLELLYLGPKDEHSAMLAQKGVRMKSLMYGKRRNYFSVKNFLDVPKSLIGVFEALWKLFWIMPDVIFSKGGPGALPVVLAGWFYRVPIVIHESDAKPGLTNLLSAYCAKRIAVAFEAALKYFHPGKGFLVGNPVRAALLDTPLVQDRSKTELGFDPSQPLLLILGGSLGSKRINEFILVNLSDLTNLTQILHQTGQANYLEVKKLSQAVLVDVPLARELSSRYQAIPYFENNLNIALNAADIVVARAGSGTINEIAAFGKPAILIPLFEAANDHQRANAYEFARIGAAVVVEEPNLLPGIFMSQLKGLLRDPAALEKMGAASRAFFRPGAAQAIAEEILKLVR